MNIVVTGGAGYIGSHTCKELARQGHKVLVYDNLCTGHREFVRWGDFVHGDIRDTTTLRACFRRFCPDGVIHFAAFAYVGESVENPGKYFSNNVTGTLSLLEAMRDEGIPHIVVSSTCAVYGQPKSMPIAETAPTRPLNPYGASKLFIEQMLADFETAHDISWMALRYFNAAGCDPDREVGEWHEPETHLIPRVLMAALGNISRVDVFGDDYSTPDGTCIRDYVHVCDLARAHVLAMDKLLSGGASRAINLGTGTGCSIREIIRCAEKISGKHVSYEIRPRRAGDPAELVADNAQAAAFLGWKPTNSGLETIMSTALNYMTGMQHQQAIRRNYYK